jgi:Ca2+-binding EF-hand superfamily protein
LTSDDLKGMKEVFDTYDTKNQGFIKASLFGKILRTLGLNPLESDIERVTKEVDPDRKNYKKKKFF